MDYAKLLAFEDGPSALGSRPVGLWVHADGSLCGVNAQHGTANRGTLFRLRADGQPEVLHGFSAQEAGGWPESLAIPCRGPAGFAYGTTGQGGAAGRGLVYRIDAAGHFEILHEFTGGSEDGGWPSSHPLVVGPDGLLYGMSISGDGALANQTLVYRMTPTGTVSPLATLNVPLGLLNGLVLGADGQLYTAASQPSGVRHALFFTINLNGAVTHKVWSTGPVDKFGDLSDWILGRDGCFYGTASNTPGRPSFGSVLRFDPQGSYQVLFSFDDKERGAYPQGVIQASDGHFYGVTLSGGAHDCGVVFRVRLNGGFKVLHSFGNDVGAELKLVEGPGQVLYGASLFGGGRHTHGGDIAGGGTVYSVSPRD